MMLSPVAIGAASCVGSALLAFWMLARRRSFGPQSVRGAGLAVLVALVLLGTLGPVMLWAVGLAGRPVALLAVADPIFVFAFWSGGLLIQAFVGGPGEPRRAYARARRSKRHRDEL
jgi:hypothetical protein